MMASLKPAQKHDQGQNDVHDADALVVDGGDPLAPQVGQMSSQDDPRKNEYDGQDHPRGRAHDDGLIERNSAPVELAKNVHCTTPGEARQIRRIGSFIDICDMTMRENRPDATAW